MARPKLKWALDAFKERDYAAEKQAKMRKNAEKIKKAKRRTTEEHISGGDSDEEIPQLVGAIVREQGASSPKVNESGLEEDESDGSSDGEDGSEEGGGGVGVDGTEDDESDGSSDSEDCSEGSGKGSGVDGTKGESDEEYSDVDLSDIENEDDLTIRDVIPHQRLTINNTAALLSVHSRIALPLSSLPFSEHLSIVSPTHIDIPDINDDLNRELAFYTQALYAANTARQNLHNEGVPFSRPGDYFAEMAKTDDHMGKIRQKLVNEAADRKAVQEARKQRDLKKFGKQVQVAKLQERQKQKREVLEKINALKRKRASGDTTLTNDDADMFDVALEQASKSEPKDRNRRTGHNPKRQKKNEKYGFGGKRRHGKSNDAVSSADITGFSSRANKAKQFGSRAKTGVKKKRPGKSVRQGRR